MGGRDRACPSIEAPSSRARPLPPLRSEVRLAGGGSLAPELVWLEAVVVPCAASRFPFHYNLYHGLERWIQVKRPLIESAKRGWEAPKCLSRQCVTKPCGTVYVRPMLATVFGHISSFSLSCCCRKDADTEYNSCDPVGVMLNAKKKKKTTRNKNKRLTWVHLIHQYTLKFQKTCKKKQLAPYWNRTSDLIITSDTLYH